MASSSLHQGHYLCPSHHGNRNTPGRECWSGALSRGAGGGAITCPQRSGPACSTPHGPHLFTNSHQFSAAAPTGFHFVPFHPAMSQPPPPYSSPSQPCILMTPSQHLFSGPWTVRLLAQWPREGATEGSGHPVS